MTPFPVKWLLAVYLALTTLQRFGELALARHNGRRLLARGAHEYGRGHGDIAGLRERAVLGPVDQLQHSGRCGVAILHCDP